VRFAGRTPPAVAIGSRLPEAADAAASQPRLSGSRTRVAAIGGSETLTAGALG
jgi:hypothetical protein